MIQPTVIAIEFLGGLLDGAVRRSNSPDVAEVTEAVRYYHLTGRGTVGWRFRVSRDDTSPDGRLAPHLYECVATGELAGVLLIRCQHRTATGDLQ